MDDLLAPAAGLNELGIGLLDRGGDHNGALSGKVRGVMAQVGRDVQVGQVVEGGAAVSVGA